MQHLPENSKTYFTGIYLEVSILEVDQLILPDHYLAENQSSLVQAF